MKVIVQQTLITVVIFSLIFTPAEAFNIQTNQLKLYRNNSNIRQPVRFQLSFKKKYTKPIFIYGISEYYLGAIYPYQNISNSMTSLTNTFATIDVSCFGSTNRLWLAIFYVVIEQSNSFLSDCVQNGYISNGVKQTQRQINVTKTRLDFSSGEFDCFPLIKGFYWNNTDSIGLLIKVSVVSKNTYTYKIKSPFNFTAQQIAFYVLFYSKTLFSTNGYSYISGGSIYSENHKISQFNKTLGDCNQSIIIFGLNGFYGMTKIVNRRLSLNLLCVFTSNQTKRFIQVNKSNWQKVYFSYIQLKISNLNETEVKQVQVSDPSFQLYPLVGGVVGGISVIILLIVVIQRCNPCQKISYPNKESVSIQNLRSFPSLSL